MIRRSIVALFAVLMILAGVVVATPPASATATGSGTVVPTPNAGGSTNQLKSVSCVSESFCMAVGYYEQSGIGAQTLAMTWTPSGGWASDTSVLNSGSFSNTLTSVSCTTTSFCMAVGYYDDGVSAQALAMKWNGAS